ncbi:glycerophosphodiester phosphodiesterase [Candidatus Nanopelagicales bacterium]|nr:glycerophosphodiester phosphodiesterase [Candidatus Nanopelagicales bacterium]
MVSILSGVTKPSESLYPVLRGALPFGIAHRGGAWEAPENTIAAFRNSVNLGFSFLETDVRATKDGVAIVFHDASLDRTTDTAGLVREMTWDQVRRAKIHGREPIMRLEELLEEFPTTRFNIDVKEANALVPFVEMVRKHAAWSRICVGSFSHERLLRVRRLGGPRLASSLSPKEVAALRLRSVGVPLIWRPPEAACVQIPVQMGGIRFAEPKLIELAHALGWQVHVWTVDDSVTMDELLELGVDAIMTDRPSLLRLVFAGHGFWPGSAS